jgi:8-oxo-dGTP pyrophosphatase MutT (NUDIX family)
MLENRTRTIQKEHCSPSAGLFQSSLHLIRLPVHTMNGAAASLDTRMVREFSAGGVVLRYMRDRWWIAAIEPQRSEAEKTKSTKPVLALPKGLIDPGEKPADTAIREVREETGVEAALIAKLTDIKYVYVRSWSDKQRVFKVVSFYLLRYRSGKLGDITPEMQHEVAHAEWIPLEEADKRVSYAGERQVVRLARQYVEANQLSTLSSSREEAEN